MSGDDPAESPDSKLTPGRFRVGSRNLITDVPGVLVGNATDEHIKSGTTVLTATRPFNASVDVMGGAPGTRETDCLAPDRLVDAIDAIVLSGGSAFGLDAASGVADALRADGRGYAVGPMRVPIVPAAIIFDLLNGGASDWLDNPYRTLGVEALCAAGETFALGSIGAGAGATSANLKGGLGSASLVLPGGATVGALVIANPNGAAVDSASGRFWAAPFEVDGEFGGRGVVDSHDPLALPRNEKYAAWLALQEPRGGNGGNGGNGGSGGNTTLAIVATDMPLDKASLKRLAVAAQDGFARALVPSHTPIDGDIVFALSTGGSRGSTAGTGGAAKLAGSDGMADMTGVGDQSATIEETGERLLLGHAASLCVARAIARGVYAASTRPRDTLVTWRFRYG